MSEKTEKPTHYKLQKAQEKGQVSKSSELNSSLFLLLMLGMITLFWPKIFSQLAVTMQNMLTMAHTTITQDKVVAIHNLIWSHLLSLWVPLAVAAVLTITLSTIAQTGFIWSATPLKPDFKRLNPASGFKKLFSSKTIFEGIKSNLKLLSVAVLLYISLAHQIPVFMHLIEIPSQAIAPIIMHALLKTAFQVLLLLVFFAVIDVFYTRWKYLKDQRMSKQEVKDEYKQREGDPKIKAKIKQLQSQLRQKIASLNQVKTADVVITNPTHLAIALKYDKSTMPAPKVVAKGQDAIAQQIRKLARSHNITIIENKAFARALFNNIELNQWISRDLYPIAAGIFKSLYEQRGNQ